MSFFFALSCVVSGDGPNIVLTTHIQRALPLCSWIVVRCSTYRHLTYGHLGGGVSPKLRRVNNRESHLLIYLLMYSCLNIYIVFIYFPVFLIYSLIYLSLFIYVLRYLFILYLFVLLINSLFYVLGYVFIYICTHMFVYLFTYLPVHLLIYTHILFMYVFIYLCSPVFI